MISLQRIATAPFSKIPTKTKNFCSISDSDMKHLQTPTRDLLKFRLVTWDSPPPLAEPHSKKNLKFVVSTRISHPQTQTINHFPN